MAVPDELIEAFDVDDAGFIADPYPVLGAIHEATPIFWNESTSQRVLTRFGDVHATLRDAASAVTTRTCSPTPMSGGTNPTRGGPTSTSTRPGHCCASSRPITPASVG